VFFLDKHLVVRGVINPSVLINTKMVRTPLRLKRLLLVCTTILTPSMKLPPTPQTNHKKMAKKKAKTEVLALITSYSLVINQTLFRVRIVSSGL